MSLSKGDKVRYEGEHLYLFGHTFTVTGKKDGHVTVAEIPLFSIPENHLKPIKKAQSVMSAR